MDAQHIPEMPESPRVVKSTKNKIRVEFNRSPLKERLKAKFLSTFFFFTHVLFFSFVFCFS